MKRNTLSCSITYLRYAAIAAILLLMPASRIMAQDEKPNIAEGDGTEDAPFIINSLRDLQAVADYYNNYTGEGPCPRWNFRLAHDINITFASSRGKTYQRFTGIDGEIIDYTGDDYRDELICDYQEYSESGNHPNPFNRYTPNPRPFTPIGTKEHPFNGSFDGAGRTIANLFFRDITTERNADGQECDKVGDVNQDCSGLFGYCDGATIVTLGVVDSYVEGRRVAAAVCANAKDTKLDNVYSSATVKMPQGESAVAAAIVGNAEGKVSLISCYNVGKVGTDGGNPLVGAVADGASVTYESCYTLGNCAPAEGLSVCPLGGDMIHASDLGDAYVDGLNGHPVLQGASYYLIDISQGIYDNPEDIDDLIVYADASPYIPTRNTAYIIYEGDGSYEEMDDDRWVENVAFLHNIMFKGDINDLNYDYDDTGNRISGMVNCNLYSWYLTDKADLELEDLSAFATDLLYPKEIFYHRDGTEGYNSTCLPFEFRASHFGAEKITGADGREHYNVEILCFMEDFGLDSQGNQIVYDGETGNGRDGVFNFGYIYTPYRMATDGSDGIFDITKEKWTRGKSLLVNTPNLKEWNMHILYNRSINIEFGFFEEVTPDEGHPQYDPTLAWMLLYDKPFTPKGSEPVYPYRTFHLGTFKLIEDLMNYNSWTESMYERVDDITEQMDFIQNNYLTYKLAVRNGKEQFVKGVQGSGVYPFRTFIICPDFAKLDGKGKENYSRMTILAQAGGTVTGIGSIDGDGKMKITPVSDVYSLDGRLVRKGGVPGKLPFDGLAPGIYVSGGKKMVIGR